MITKDTIGAEFAWEYLLKLITQEVSISDILKDAQVARRVLVGIYNKDCETLTDEEALEALEKEVATSLKLKQGITETKDNETDKDTQSEVITDEVEQEKSVSTVKSLNKLNTEVKWVSIGLSSKLDNVGLKDLRGKFGSVTPSSEYLEIKEIDKSVDGAMMPDNAISNDVDKPAADILDNENNDEPADIVPDVVNEPDNSISNDVNELADDTLDNDNVDESDNSISNEVDESDNSISKVVNESDNSISNDVDEPDNVVPDVDESADDTLDVVDEPADDTLDVVDKPDNSISNVVGEPDNITLDNDNVNEPVDAVSNDIDEPVDVISDVVDENDVELIVLNKDMTEVSDEIARDLDNNNEINEPEVLNKIIDEVVSADEINKESEIVDEVRDLVNRDEINDKIDDIPVVKDIPKASDVSYIDNKDSDEMEDNVVVSKTLDMSVQIQRLNDLENREAGVYYLGTDNQFYNEFIPSATTIAVVGDVEDLTDLEEISPVTVYLVNVNDNVILSDSVKELVIRGSYSQDLSETVQWLPYLVKFYLDKSDTEVVELGIGDLNDIVMNDVPNLLEVLLSECINLNNLEIHGEKGSPLDIVKLPANFRDNYQRFDINDKFDKDITKIEFI